MTSIFWAPCPQACGKQTRQLRNLRNSSHDGSRNVSYKGSYNRSYNGSYNEKKVRTMFVQCPTKVRTILYILLGHCTNCLAIIRTFLPSWHFWPFFEFCTGNVRTRSLILKLQRRAKKTNGTDCANNPNSSFCLILYAAILTFKKTPVLLSWVCWPL